MCLQPVNSACFRTGILVYILTAIPVFLGAIVGTDLVAPSSETEQSSKPDLCAVCSRMNGLDYALIVEKGYSYDPKSRSVVAFFPAYPLAGRVVVALTGWDPKCSLLLVSNAFLLGALIVFSFYLNSLRHRSLFHNGVIVLVFFALFPPGFFFRMAYAESTFLFFTMLALCGMSRAWPLPVLAAFAGFATAARPVGLAVTAAFTCHVLSTADPGSVARRLVRAAAWTPVACWGLLAYMAYLYYRFDNPLAFAQTQDHWGLSSRDYGDLWYKSECLLSGEPIWGAYTSDPLRNWRRFGGLENVFFNLSFWNPVIFIGAFLLVLLGTLRYWLSPAEAILGFGLLFIPYVTRAFEMSMASHARFASVVVPAYITAGRLLERLPQWVFWSIIGLFSVFLMLWSALFAAGYPFF
jgi:hypothetical protein